LIGLFTTNSESIFINLRNEREEERKKKTVPLFYVGVKKSCSFRRKRRIRRTEYKEEI